jgi:hypothetical protein
LAAVALGAAAPALGAGPAGAAYAEAQSFERALDFPRALEGYRRVVALEPAGPFAEAARTRAEALAAMSAGEFGPLRELEALRRDPARLTSPDALEGFARRAEAFPPGLVRDEARALAAEALVRRLGEAGRGSAVARALADDATASRSARAQGAALVAEAASAAGDDAGAARIARRYGALVPGQARRYERRAWWRRGRAAAATSLGALALGALGASRGVARRGGRGLVRSFAVARAPAALTGALVAAGAWLAAWQSPGATPRPFLTLGAAVPLVDAAVALVGRRLGGASWGRPFALACGLLGIVAAAYVALAWHDPAYLESLLGWS